VSRARPSPGKPHDHTLAGTSNHSIHPWTMHPETYIFTCRSTRVSGCLRSPCAAAAEPSRRPAKPAAPLALAGDWRARAGRRHWIGLGRSTRRHSLPAAGPFPARLANPSAIRPAGYWRCIRKLRPWWRRWPAYSPAPERPGSGHRASSTASTTATTVSTHGRTAGRPASSSISVLSDAQPQPLVLVLGS
jgi:hypothetical protein